MIWCILYYKSWGGIVISPALSWFCWGWGSKIPTKMEFLVIQVAVGFIIPPYWRHTFLAVKGGIWIPRLHPGLLKGVWNLISTMTEDRTSWIRLLGRHVESGMSKAAYLKWSHFLNNPMLQVCHTIELSCKLQCCWMWVPWQWLAWTFTRVMCPSIRIAWIQVCTNI